jgi:hypothetical protein
MKVDQALVGGKALSLAVVQIKTSGNLLGNAP